jgi:4-diphosphocytidyl-2-C-methyl-D-erythritol kinase
LIEKLDTPHEVAQVMVNDLETVTIGRYPRIARLKERLEEEGAIGSLMSGSGSAVFGIFADEADAKRAFAGFEGEKDIRAYLAFSLT